MLILLFMRGVRMHIRSVLQWIVVAAVVFVSGHAWGQNSSAMSAGTIPAAQLIQVDELKAMLATQDAQKAPVILQVGSHLFFNEAHIPGSQYAGPGSQPAGLALLEKTVSPLPKNKLIVLYCGCCPWNRCPNVGPAYKRLHELGYTNVKVLYLANNFGDDWVSKGYPTQK
jgi:thiosulfate/3-mercaptopyruvate sulfurtransferase